MRLPRGPVRYHAPRERSPVPALVVGAAVVVTLVSAQLAIAAEPAGSSPAVGAAAATQVAESPDGAPTATEASPSTDPPSTAPAETAVDGDDSPPQVELSFAVGADAPSGDAGALLGPVIEALLADPATRVRVVGHAAPSNDPVLEEQLSLSRAETVLDLLQERGIAADRADVVGAGAAEAGQSSSGIDRRVTVEVVTG